MYFWMGWTKSTAGKWDFVINPTDFTTKILENLQGDCT